MTARELLTVMLMTIGTIWAVISFVLLINHFLDATYLPPDLFLNEKIGFIGSAINFFCGLVLLFSANTIARLIKRD